MRYFSKEFLKAVVESHDITFIDLRRDYAFSLVFGTQGHEDALLKLVNAILPEKGICSVTLDPTANAGMRPDARRTVFDIFCTTDKGERLNLEMQFKSQDDFNDRMLFYSSFPIINSLQSGDEKFTITPLYVIGITNFIISSVAPNDRLINRYRILNEDGSGAEFTKNMQFITVELPKFRKTLEDLETPADMMLYTLANIHGMKEMPESFVGSGLENIFQMCRFADMDFNIQMDYVREFMAEVDERSRLRTARQEGEAKGEARGKAKGKKEGKIETARKLKQLGVAVETICEATGLSKDAVEAL